MLIRILSLEISYDVIGLALGEVEQTKGFYFFKLRIGTGKRSFEG